VECRNLELYFELVSDELVNVPDFACPSDALDQLSLLLALLVRLDLEPVVVFFLRELYVFDQSHIFLL